MLKDLSISDKIILKDVYIADNFFSRLFGYMFQCEPKYNAIVFKPCNSIHTFFMKFKIDVLFLDQEYKVIKVIKNLEKGKMILPIKGAKLVIETIEGGFNGVEVGGILSGLE